MRMESLYVIGKTLTPPLPLPYRGGESLVIGSNI